MGSKRPEATNIDWYTVRQVARVSGLSTHMVDYLCRHGVVTPSGGCQGRGRQRRYTFQDIVVLRVVARLLRQGVSVIKFRKGFLSLKQRNGNARHLLACRYLVTDGNEVFLQNDGVLERLESGQTSFAFVLDLAPVRKDVVSGLKRIRTPA